MGFNADEEGRRFGDQAASEVPGRTGVFPLIDWGWDRQQCEAYLVDRFGVHGPKSYCTSCFMWNRAGLTCRRGPDPVGPVPHCCRASNGPPMAAVHDEHRTGTQHDRRLRAGGRGPSAVLYG